jgi:SAM-dependent methyltransferase
MPEEPIWKGGHALMRHYRPLLQKLVDETPGRKLAVLDVGCWQKQYKPFFRGRDAKYVGLDIEKTPYADVVGDVHKLPFKKESFDVVLCLEVLEHVRKPWVAVEEIRRVLKKNGTLIASVPFYFPAHACPNDYWRFTADGLEILLENYRSVKTYRVGNAATSYFLHNSNYASLLPRWLAPVKGAIYLADNVMEPLAHPVYDNDAFTACYMAKARK